MCKVGGWRRRCEVENAGKGQRVPPASCFLRSHVLQGLEALVFGAAVHEGGSLLRAACIASSSRRRRSMSTSCVQGGLVGLAKFLMSGLHWSSTSRSLYRRLTGKGQWLFCLCLVVKGWPSPGLPEPLSGGEGVAQPWTLRACVCLRMLVLCRHQGTKAWLPTSTHKHSCEL